MPKPPILPTIDWKELFEKGAAFEDWIKTGESESNRELMKKHQGEHEPAPEIEAGMRAVDRDVHVIAIAEDWCPDVIRHVPVLMKMAGLSPHLKIRFLEREQSPEAFVRFLTIGGEAIPQFIFFNDKFVECGHWGPMQADLREVIARGKACENVPAARKIVYEAYRADAECVQAAKELLHLIEVASAKAP